MKKKLPKLLSKFSKIRILVIGDLILDEYIYGNADRISPEAPVPVVWAHEKEYLPGGASNVATNITSLGAKVSVVGLVGKDDRSDILLSELSKRGIDTAGVFEVYNRSTSIKTRIVAGSQQVVRVDWETVDPIQESSEKKVRDYIKKNIKNFDAIIIEDYGKGLITPDIVACAVAESQLQRKIITVDPKEEHFGYYKGVTAITPNRREAENAIRNIKIKSLENNLRVFSDRLENSEDIDLAGRELVSYLNLEGILITLGNEGMRLFECNKKPHHIDTVAQEVFDVSGAGDTVIAAFTLALASGATMVEAAEIANFAAGIVVGRRGVAIVTQKDLQDKVKTYKKKRIS